MNEWIVEMPDGSILIVSSGAKAEAARKHWLRRNRRRAS